MRKFISDLNTAKNIDYIEKCLKQKLYRIKFATKNSVDAYLYLLLKLSYEALKIYFRF